MGNETACKSKSEALALLEAVIMHTYVGPERSNLETVKSWIQENFRDVPDDPAERRDLIREIQTEIRNCMGIEDRRAYAAFFADSVVTQSEFDAMDEYEQTEFLNNGGLVEPDLAE
jgi:hypothetical protein